MTVEDFNNKYKDYLEEGFYGLSISKDNVISYLNEEFEKEVKNNPNFKYSQIKVKFGTPVVYAETDVLNIRRWEAMLDYKLKH